MSSSDDDDFDDKFPSEAAARAKSPYSRARWTQIFFVRAPLVSLDAC